MTNRPPSFAFVGPDRIHRAARRNVCTRGTTLPTMTARVLCGSGPACPVYPDAGRNEGRVRAAFARTDLRCCAWHRLARRGGLQPVCLCLRRGGVYPARRRKAPSIRFVDLSRFSLRQGAACLRRQARRRFAVVFVFVGAGLIPARRRKAPCIRFLGPSRLSMG